MKSIVRKAHVDVEVELGNLRTDKRRIEDDIRALTKCRAPDQLKISALKRKKLRLKERIVALGGGEERKPPHLTIVR